MMTLSRAVCLALLVVGGTVQAEPSLTAESVKAFNDKVLNMKISGTGTVHTTFHDKSKLMGSMDRQGINVSGIGLTTSTIEYDHNFTFAMHGHDYYLKSDNFVGTTATSTRVQQNRESGMITYKTSNGRTFFKTSDKDKDDQREPYLDFVLIFPDAYYNDDVFKIPDVKETEDKVTITGKVSVTVFRKGKYPNLLLKILKDKSNGQVAWKREYSDHVSYRGVELPQTVVDTVYNTEGKPFRTMTYKLIYKDDNKIDELIDKKVELPKGAIKGDLNKPF